MKIIFYILPLTLLCQLAPLQAETQFSKDLEVTRNIYLGATDGEKRAVRKAIRAATKLEKKYRNHPLALAYKGGALALRGIDISKRPLDRMRDTEEGLNLIDRALRKLPRHKGLSIENIETKLVSAYVFINLPDSVFHRLREGHHLIQQLLKHPELPAQPQALQAAIYFAAAVSADKHNIPEKFKYYLELTEETDPDSLTGKEARALLDKLEN